jgi:hypothetical protein
MIITATGTELQSMYLRAQKRGQPSPKASKERRKTHETMIVKRACDGGRTAATIPPVALATFGATIGSSQAGEIVLSVEACWWRVKTKNLRTSESQLASLRRM